VIHPAGDHGADHPQQAGDLDDNRITPRRTVAPRIDQGGIGRETIAHGGCERLVQLGGHIDLGHPGADRRGQRRIGHSRRAVQDQRDADRTMDPGDKPGVQDGIAGQHRVGAADRHGQGIHARGIDVAGRVAGVRARTGRVHAVLPADLAELGLDPHPPLVTPPGDSGRSADVLVVGQGRRVVHDRSDAQAVGLPDQIGAGDVVQVQRHRHRRRARDGGAGPAQRAECAVVGNAVLAELKDHGRAGGFSTGHDRLGVLDADDVEGAHTAARRRRRPDDLFHPRCGHQPASPRSP
jgi:hypothetical protein